MIIFPVPSRGNPRFPGEESLHPLSGGGSAQMTENPDPSGTSTGSIGDVAGAILANRRAFGRYNVARLRELLRRLSEERLEAFHTIPLLVHLNSRRLPGYVDDPDTPHGIYRFAESGFWRTGRRYLGIEDGSVGLVVRRYHVLGLYLAGSCGTLCQTDRSDFNYWVVVEPGSASGRRGELLRTKLDGIRRWSEASRGQPLTFLVVDLEQIRRNDFSGLGDPCFIPRQGSLVKEAFYRSFILVAGRIPYWAVLPPGLDAEARRRWIEAAEGSRGKGFDPSDYVDLGGLDGIDPGHCPAAVLSAVCTAERDPARSLAAGALAAHHDAAWKKRVPLCDGIKEAFLEGRAGARRPDPCGAALEKAIELFERIDDPEGVDLLRQCLWLRVLGSPVPASGETDDLKRAFLERLAERWGWPRSRRLRLRSYRDWPEADKLDLDRRFLARLWSLYGRVVAEKGRTGPAEGEGPRLEPLRERLARHLAAGPEKIPTASAFLRALDPDPDLWVAHERGRGGMDRWTVYRGTGAAGASGGDPLFSARELPRLLAWIVLYDLSRGRRSPVSFSRMESLIAAKRAEGLLAEMFDFFSMERTACCLEEEASWRRLMVVLDYGLTPASGGLRVVELLARNTWGEIHFASLDLGAVENGLLKCYEVAKKIRDYEQEALPGRLEYRIYHSLRVEDPSTTRKIEAFVRSLRAGDPGDPPR